MGNRSYQGKQTVRKFAMLVVGLLNNKLCNSHAIDPSCFGKGEGKKGTFEPFWASHWYKPAIQQRRWRAQPHENPIKLTKYDESIAQLKEILQIFEWFLRLKKNELLTEDDQKKHIQNERNNTDKDSLREDCVLLG